MKFFAFFRRTQRPIVVDRHPGGGFRNPAERIVDPVELPPKPAPKPISHYVLAPFKMVLGFLANLFLAILGVVAVGMKMPIFYLFLALASCVGVGALNDINTANHGTVVGAQVALVLFAIICFFGFCDSVSRR